MAQLFTVYFPKYCFEVQQEYEIKFPSAGNLPFIPYVNKDGITHIKDINYDEDIHGADQIQQWMEKGLKAGLRIIKINGINLAQETIDGAGNDLGLTSTLHVCTNDKLIDRINRCGNAPISITVKEEVPFIDDSESLGLQYKHHQNDNNDDDEIKSIDTIQDHQISVSSYDENHDRTKCRLNTPNNHWSPHKTNENERNVWISFDLLSQKLVDKIHIQGDEYHDNYVQQIWIDYSHDGCLWKTHPLGCIKCRYINSNNSEHHSAELVSSTSNDNNIGGIPSPLSLDLDKTSMKDIGNKNGTVYDMAIIKLWPAINARFIRIRPVEWNGRCSMRIELLGNHRPVNDQQFGRIVTAKTVNPKYKQQLLNTLRNKCDPKHLMKRDDIDNKTAIQVDCKSVVDAAMEVAGCSSYSVIEPDENDNYLLLFTTSSASASERVMDSLAQVGVGQAMGVISATSLEWRNAAKDEWCKIANHKPKHEATGFYASVKSHQAIQVVVKRIMGAASFTFDYFCMLTVASCIAVGGLAVNSPVIVVASMLVSPIMGPVLAFTFGVTIKEWHMARLGIRNEIFSLCICVVLGSVFGFLYALISQNRYDWPTNEMTSRGNPWSLLDGAYIAAFSGVGVALSVLGDYLSTVVGVAISASLLPPAVNCGMLLAFTVYELLFPQNVDSDGYNADNVFLMSIISLLLTIENIFIIFGTARLMFWIKNVVKTNDHNQQTVWDSVSNFQRDHRSRKGLQRGYGERDVTQNHRLSSVDFDGSIDDEPDDIEGYVANIQYHDNIDIYTKPGSRAHKAMNAVTDTYTFTTDIMRRNTLKKTILKQASRHYEYEQGIISTDEDEIEMDNINTPSIPSKNSMIRMKLRINKSLSPQVQLPLIEEDENKIAIDVIDEDEEENDINENDTNENV